jgi:hypothetical protein
MRRLLIILVVAVLLLGGAFVVLAPASLVTGRVERMSNGTLTARNVEGTVWRGRGVLTASDAQVPIAWTLDPESMLRGELQAHIGPYDGVGNVPRADVLAGRERVQLRDVEMTLPVPLLSELVGGRLAHRLGLIAEGDVSIKSNDLDWIPPTSVNGNLDVQWRRARFNLPGSAPIDLGDVTARLNANGQQLAGPIDNQGGVLDIRGDLTMRPDKSGSVSVLLTPRRSDDQVLQRALATIGTPEGNGWRVGWQTPAR